jgi:hypothetical protein
VRHRPWSRAAGHRAGCAKNSTLSSPGPRPSICRLTVKNIGRAGRWIAPT